MEVVSEPPLGFKAKAEDGVQPQEYICILRIERRAPTPELGS
jgi:hypothetical protein